jgi:alkanesulfonate monooxygenase SsuD/methylene tetrahydromethanopterin reductase-like flavin-dependent oxidoreductase (luciferase family)
MQQPHPPIVVGGNSEGSFRRAVEQGNGWYGYGLDVEDAKRAIALLRVAAVKYPRPAELGEMEISVNPRVPVDRATAQRFVELGVHRLILSAPQNADVPAVEGFVQAVGSSLVGQV